MISMPVRTLCTSALMLAAVCLGANAQGFPPAAPGASGPSAQAQICQRLEQQLHALDRGDPARNEQIRRYEDAANRQQAELDRTIAQSRRLGCESVGFFTLFGAGNAQCGPINRQISQMRANLDKITGDLQRIQGAGVDYERDGQRRAVLAALARNDCGPQYRQAAASPQGRSLFESLFGSNPLFQQHASGNTYRTICVRTCDGFYYPISFATTSARFDEDERVCRRMCPAAEVLLFSYRNPGEEVSQAVSAGGRLYTELPNAFKYRQEYNPACSCRRAGESWAEALKGLDDRSTLDQGDIVVTEERAKALSAPRDARGRPIKPATAAGQPGAQPTPTPAGGGAPDAPKPAIRTVGPQLGPVR
ncbi:MAG: hypothetical protein GHHEDOFH_00899 [Pseudorhodoplanes sp.]|nr:hypothetical protein [Pseudorhodoplanes sp.]GIK81782.1 MAG: hypothetical protein BroJett024_28870 [Alphaproteobacteria bacterium]